MSNDALPLVNRLGLQQPIRWGASGVSSPDQAFALPVGTVTFLLTDIEGSTRQWSTEPSDAMASAVRRHTEILAEAVEREGGVRPQEQGEGDSIVAAFARPSAALAAAIAAQRALSVEPWPTAQPVKVRMAVHTGEVQLRDDYNYAGQAIIRCARLRALSHGGQVLVSGATRDLAVDQDSRFEFCDLGEHPLRDLTRPERIYQLVADGLDTEFAALITAAPQHNLPTLLSAFVGRRLEVAELRGLVSHERLVTLIGAGGVGKTRLALQAAAELLDEFPGGMVWVDLVPVKGGEVSSAVVSAFGSPNPASDAVEVVERVLGAKRGLVVLDNCEHVLDDASSLAHRLVAAVPGLHLVATSRTPLDLPGERTWRVPGLSTPAVVSEALDVLSQFDAVRLFADRAGRAKPNFRLDESNAATIAELVHRLDGMPLAVELAAARVRTLSPAQVLAGLDDALRLLTGGSRAVLPRQQTLEGSILWSYQLLSAAEQRMLRGLAVFVDGCTLDASEVVCAGGDLASEAAFDALDRLVAQSMVQVVEVAETEVHRFVLLETVRQFAQRMTDSDELIELRCNHANWIVAEARRLDELSATSAFLASRALVAADEANFRAALARLVAEGRTDDAYDVVAAMEHPLTLSGRLVALQEMAEAVLRAIPPPGANATHHLQLISISARTMANVDIEAMVLGLGALAASCGDDVLNSVRARLASDQWLATAGVVPIGHVERLIDRLRELGDVRRAAWSAMGIATMATIIGGGQADVRRRIAEFEESPECDDPMASVLARLSAAMLDLAEGDVRDVADRCGGDVVDRFVPAMLVGTLALSLGVAALYAPDVDLTATTQAVGQRARAGGEQGLVYAEHFLMAVDAVRLGDVDAARGLLRSEGSAFDGYATMLDPPGMVVFGGLDMLPPNNVPGQGRYMAEAARRVGDLAKATARCHNLLNTAIEWEWPFLLAIGLDDLTAILSDGGHHRDALRILGAVDQFFEVRRLVRPPHLAQRRSALLDAARVVMGDDYEGALTEGADLDVAAAADYARRNRAAHGTSVTGWDALTPTEAKVAELVAEGRSNPEVAKELLMGVATVKTHLARVFDKVGVRNRQELVLSASRRATGPPENGSPRARSK